MKPVTDSELLTYVMKPVTDSEKLSFLFERAWRKDLKRLESALEVAAKPELGGRLVKDYLASQEASPAFDLELSPQLSKPQASDPLLLSVVQSLQNMGPQFLSSLLVLIVGTVDFNEDDNFSGQEVA